jgi:hypothetical protein
MSTDRIVQNADCFAPGKGEGGGEGEGRRVKERICLVSFCIVKIHQTDTPNVLSPKGTWKTAGESSAPLSGCTSITPSSHHHHPSPPDKTGSPAKRNKGWYEKSKK